jgi:hypothetical protein
VKQVVTNCAQHEIASGNSHLECLSGLAIFEQPAQLNVGAAQDQKI